MRASCRGTSSPSTQAMPLAKGLVFVARTVCRVSYAAKNFCIVAIFGLCRIKIKDELDMFHNDLVPYTLKYPFEIIIIRVTTKGLSCQISR